MATNSFLTDIFKGDGVFNSESSLIWKEIVSRWSQADYDDLTIRAERQAILEAEWTANQYQRDRKEEYDALNQFELISDDAINGTTTHKDAIVAIKTKYPKG